MIDMVVDVFSTAVSMCFGGVVRYQAYEKATLEAIELYAQNDKEQAEFAENKRLVEEGRAALEKNIKEFKST